MATAVTSAADVPVSKRLRRIAEEEADPEDGEYNSYERFQLDELPQKSPAWKIAMINFLLDMKKNGHTINEFNDVSKKS